MRIVYRPLVAPDEPHKGRRIPSPFSAAWGTTTDLLKREAEHLNWRAAEIVIQVAVQERDIRLDGDMRADFREPWSPAVRVIVTGRKGEVLKFECDRYSKWRENVRAIALTMEKLRAVERYGTGRGGEAYVGFRELPSGIALGPAMSEREAQDTLLDAAEMQRVPEVDTYGSGPDSEWRYIFDRARKKAHPDNGGSHDAFIAVQRAGEVLGLTKGGK